MAQDADLGRVIDGKYQLLRLLGAGSMGRVFEARHLQLGHRVAVKLLHPGLNQSPEITARFVQEARAAASIGSEHIIQVADLGQTREGERFLILEYLEGEDLAQAALSQGPLPADRIARIARQICLGVGAAHDRGIIHRDLKPENIFLTRRDDGSDWIKVLDFGVAKVQDSLANPATQLTQTGTTLGTPYYMSPEQLNGARDLDGRADVYSLGVILYELLTGELPYRASSFADLLVQVSTTEPPPPRRRRPELSQAFEAVVLRAMARERDGRIASMQALSAALAPFARQGRAIPETLVPVASPLVPQTLFMTPGPTEGHFPSAPPPGGDAPLGKRRWPIIVGGALGGGLGLVAALALALALLPPSDPAPVSSAPGLASIPPPPVTPVTPMTPVAPLPMTPTPPPAAPPAPTTSAMPVYPTLPEQAQPVAVIAAPPGAPGPLAPGAVTAQPAPPVHPCLGRWAGAIRQSDGSRGSGTVELNGTEGQCGGFVERWRSGTTCRYRLSDCRAEGDQIRAGARAAGGRTPGGGCSPVRMTFTCDADQLRFHEAAGYATVQAVLSRRP